MGSLQGLRRRTPEPRPKEELPFKILIFPLQPGLVVLLHDGMDYRGASPHDGCIATRWVPHPSQKARDRKSTRLNSSHQIISYAVFCLIKKLLQIFKKHRTTYINSLFE